MANQAKRERFLKLADKRVNNAIKALRGVDNLSSPKSYEYTAEEAAQIVSALTEQVERIKKHFLEGDTPSAEIFRLKVNGDSPNPASQAAAKETP